MEPFSALGIIFFALLGSTLASVTGFGAVIVMLPFMVITFGVREAIPIMAVSQVVNTLGRVWFNRAELAWPPIRWFAGGAVPTTFAGAALFVVAPSGVIERLLGLLLLAIVIVRHTTIIGRRARLHSRAFLPLGAVMGFGSAFLGAMGPVMTPFCLAHGLTRGALVGTQALALLVLNGTKLVAYGGYSLMSPRIFAIGLAIGVITLFGAFLGKVALDRVSEHVFPYLVEGALVAAGLWFVF